MKSATANHTALQPAFGQIRTLPGRGICCKTWTGGSGSVSQNRSALFQGRHFEEISQPSLNSTDRVFGYYGVAGPGALLVKPHRRNSAVRQTWLTGLYYRFSVMMSDSSSLNPPAAAMAINARPQNN